MASSSTESDCLSSFSGRLLNLDDTSTTTRKHVSISTPLIIGLSVGVAFCIIVLAGLLILVYYQYRKRHLSRQNQAVTPESEVGAPPEGQGPEALIPQDPEQTRSTPPGLDRPEQSSAAAPEPVISQRKPLCKVLALFQWKKAFRQQRSEQQAMPANATDTELQEYQEKAIADRQAKKELDCFYSRYGYFDADRHRRQH